MDYRKVMQLGLMPLSRTKPKERGKSRRNPDDPATDPAAASSPVATQVEQDPTVLDEPVENVAH